MDGHPPGLGTLSGLRDWLVASGYQDLMLGYDPIRVLYWAEADMGSKLSGTLARIFNLLAGGGTLDAAELDCVPRPCRDALAEAGVLVESAAGWSLAGYALLPIWGSWLLCSRPSTSEPMAYFGEDSMGLRLRLMVPRDARVLDLCAGPGAQTLQVAAQARDVVAVELDDRVREALAFNLRLNDAADRVRVRIGDLYAALGAGDREPFDHIVANPPLVPVPDSVRYPVAGRGGPDGLAITRRILDGLPDHLAPGGQAQVLGATLSDGLLPLCRDEFEAWAERRQCRLVMTVSCHLSLAPGRQMLNALVETSVKAGEDRWSALMQFDKCFASQQATHMCCFHLRVMRDRQPGLVLTDPTMPGDRAHALWFR